MEILYRISHTSFLQSNNSLCPLVSEKIFLISANRNKNCTCFCPIGMKSYRRHSIDASCLLPSFGSFGQAVSEGKIFQKLTNLNKNSLWRPCLLTDRDEMSNLYRGLSIDASYHVSVHLTKRFQTRRLLEINQPETRNA
jgi:hypothetical protein